MKKTAIHLIIFLMIAFTFTACNTHQHVVGTGPKTNAKVEERQWYILFGLVPLNDVDSKKLAGGATDYKIQTQLTPLDIILNIFTGFVTIGSRTVEVTK
jgi:predicted small secreted protein